MFSNTRIIHDPEIESALRKRFGKAITELEESGCAYEGTLENEHHLPLLPLVFWLGLLGETWRWKSPFRLSWYHPVLRSADGTTLAYPFAIGTRLYTFFDDGSGHRTSACPHQESTQYHKRCNLFVANVNHEGADITALLERHQGFVEQYRIGGKSPLKSALDELIAMQTAEDSILSLVCFSCLGWGGMIYLYYVGLSMSLGA